MRTIIKLKNLTPIHIGTGKENYDFSSSTLQSDTISSALAAIRVEYFGKEDVESFISSFTVSSMFPYVDKEYFLPKPHGRLNVKMDGEEHTYRKQLKKIKYIEKSLWQDIVSGEEVKVSEQQIQGEYLLSMQMVGQFEKPYENQVNQRVTVPRGDSKEAKPFFFDWSYFRENAGLYCILECADESMPEMEQLFAILGESGIGTDKNIGGGKFEIEIVKDMPIAQNVEGANSTILLSLYVPTREELEMLELSTSTYALQQRGGYISGGAEVELRHLRKKSIYMFDVGSVFTTTQKLGGKVVNLKPEYNDARMHPIYRNGKPVTVQIKI